MNATYLFFLAIGAAVLGIIQYKKSPDIYLAGLIVIALLTAFGLSMNEVNHAKSVTIQAQEDSLES